MYPPSQGTYYGGIVDPEMIMTLVIIGCIVSVMFGPSLFDALGDSVGAVAGIVSPDNINALAGVQGTALSSIGKGIGDVKDSTVGRGKIFDVHGDNDKDKKRRQKLKKQKRAAAAEADATAASQDQDFRDKWGGFTKEEVKNASVGIAGVVFVIGAFLMVRLTKSKSSSKSE